MKSTGTVIAQAMQTENQIIICGDKARIFAIASNISDWPRLLPHYRWVRILKDDGRVRHAEMAARRGRLPVRWRAAQVLLPEEDRIVFAHTGGVTRGMYVEWRLTQAGAGSVKVAIHHELDYPLPLVTGWFARRIVGALFVHHIAGLTLARVKEIVEDGGN